jgi:hypothetical protein
VWWGQGALRVCDLMLEEEEDKVELATALWEEGLVATLGT